MQVIGGFHSVTVERCDNIPHMIIRHYSVDGDIYNEDIIVSR